MTDTAIITGRCTCGDRCLARHFVVTEFDNYEAPVRIHGRDPSGAWGPVTLSGRWLKNVTTIEPLSDEMWAEYCAWRLLEGSN